MSWNTSQGTLPCVYKSIQPRKPTNHLYSLLSQPLLRLQGPIVYPYEDWATLRSNSAIETWRAGESVEVLLELRRWGRRKAGSQPDDRYPTPLRTSGGMASYHHVDNENAETSPRRSVGWTVCPARQPCLEPGLNRGWVVVSTIRTYQVQSNFVNDTEEYILNLDYHQHFHVTS